MTSYPEPFLCAYCKHLDWDVQLDESGFIRKTCRAFPSGIPSRFLSPDGFHTTTTGDDNGIVFEPAEDAENIPPNLAEGAGL